MEFLGLFGLFIFDVETYFLFVFFFHRIFFEYTVSIHKDII